MTEAIDVWMKLFEWNFQITWQKITPWEKRNFIMDLPTHWQMLPQPVQKQDVSVPVLFLLDIICYEAIFWSQIICCLYAAVSFHWTVCFPLLTWLCWCSLRMVRLSFHGVSLRLVDLWPGYGVHYYPGGYLPCGQLTRYVENNVLWFQGRGGQSLIIREPH